MAEFNQRVILPAEEAEGFCEERGEVVGNSGNGVVIVRVDEPYRRGAGDDMLREVDAEQLVPEAQRQALNARMYDYYFG